MKKESLKKLIYILGSVLAAMLLLLVVLIQTETKPSAPAQIAESTASTKPTEPAVTESTQPPAVEVLAEEEPKEQRYVLTFVGDCTLGSVTNWFKHPRGFLRTIGEDYDYPFSNVVKYFENDDFTMINLEGVFADSGKRQNKLFTFRGPTEYINILTGSSVEAVTLANNHSKDFGTAGYNSTKEVLEKGGITYVEEEKTAMYTTEEGLVIGLYADHKNLSADDIRMNVKNLKESGAEIIICAFHWGKEGSYRANAKQKNFAKIAIEAGADIIYGHHPHVLQKIVRNEDSVIFYSLGNFSFGGHMDPRDKDSAVVQQEVIRDADGTVRLGELTIIPVCISSVKNRNDYRPTPYEVGSKEYLRALSKLEGTFKGPDLVVNYHKKKDEAATPGETPAPDPAGSVLQFAENQTAYPKYYYIMKKAMNVFPDDLV